MNTREVLRKNGKAFSWSASFLPKEISQDISDLYAFCRYVDDLVDIKNESCRSILRDLQASSSQTETISKLIALQKKRKMSIEPAIILVKTLDQDRRGTCIKSKKELIRYCYGVASTVGLMMCEIFGVETKEALPFAIDLGIGMQLTNIARDVYEDAQNERIYLPQEYFKKGITFHAILKGHKNAEICAVREEILKLADRYYQSADYGMPFLPPRVRVAILIASRLYQAKGHVIRRNPNLYLKKRADVPLSGKIYHTLKALAHLPKLSRKKRSEKKGHDATLHIDLKSLPAVDTI